MAEVSAVTVRLVPVKPGVGLARICAHTNTTIAPIRSTKGTIFDGSGITPRSYPPARS